MLLYNNQDECDSAAIDSLNEGLKVGQLCIYASVSNGDKSHLSRIYLNYKLSGKYRERQLGHN